MKRVCDVHIYRLFFVTLNEIGGKSTWEKLAISCTHSASLISVNSNFWRKFRTKITKISQTTGHCLWNSLFSSNRDTIGKQHQNMKLPLRSLSRNSLGSLKFLDFPRNSLKFLGFPRNSLKFLGFPRNSLISRNHQDSLVFLGIP